MSLRAVRALAFAAAAASLAPAARAFDLDGSRAVLVLPAASSSILSLPPALGLALRDVQRDYYAVTGFAPLTRTSVPAPGELPADFVVVYLLSASDSPPAGFANVSACFAGWESHCVLAAPRGGGAPGGYASILATGTGLRGAIFGWFSFSEAVLNVNPSYRITDDLPAYSAAPLPVPDNLALVFAPPAFKYRAWFVNDEDLLAGHATDPAGAAVFSLTAWDEILETLLRLKGNAIIPGTNPFPDEASVALVVRRGLVLQAHHYDLLGLNVFAWPLPQSDWNWDTNTGTMAYVWRASVAAQAALGGEVVYSVGLRGLNDYDYPCPSPAECGRVISSAVSNQTAWVAAAAGPSAPCVLFLWDAMLGLLESGDLVLPPNVDIIFTDSGAGYINVDANLTKYAAGAYYHTAMYNNVGNQLGEMVPADRIFAQFAAYLRYANRTTYVIDNLSDVRPALMTSAALLALAWDPAPYTTSSDYAATARAWYAAWGARNAGLSAADAATFAGVWADYFAVPYIQSGAADGRLCSLLASVAAAAAPELAATGNVTAATAAAAAAALGQVGGAATSTALLAVLARARALAAAGAVPAARAPFYAAHTLVGIGTTAHGAAALAALAGAVAAVRAGDAAGAAAGFAAALAELDGVLADRRAGEYGKWAGFWRTDHLSDVQRSRRAVAAAAGALANRGAPLAPVPPFLWYDFEDYLQPYAANYPLMHPNPAWQLATYTRVNCVVSDVSAGTCANAPDGGAFTPNAGAAVTLQVMTSQTAADASYAIRYTLDGSAPTAGSPAYVAGQPIRLDAAAVGGAATIRAIAFTPAGEPAAARTTDAVYVARALAPPSAPVPAPARPSAPAVLDLSPSRLAAARATLERLRADAPPRHTAQAALAAHELAPLAGAGVVIASLHAPVYVWGVAGLRRVWRGDAGGVADAPPAIVAGATGLAPPPAQTIVVRAADVGGACGAVPSSARAATFARGCVVESMAIDFAVDARRCGGDAGAAAPPRAPHPHPHPPTSAAPSMALAHACNEGGAAGLADDGVAAGAAGLAPLPASAAARVSGRGGEAGAALLPPAPRGGHAARVRVLAELALAEADAAPPASARGGARGASWSRESRLALAELRAHAGTGERLDWRRMVAWRALQRQVL